MRVRLLFSIAALAVSAAVVEPAGATFPGANGPILFREVDLDTGDAAPLFRALPDGSQVTRLSKRPGFMSDWRADGGRIAFDFFDRKGNVQIATMTPGGDDLQVLTSGSGIHEAPSWSPDGRHIVFDASKGDPNDPDFHTRLWIMRADGSHARRLRMRSHKFEVEPRYSPDGTRIAFQRIRLEDDEFFQAVFVLDIRTGKAVKVTAWHLASEHPTWSPDGRWILYNNSPDGTIQVVRPTGLDRRTIAPATPGFGGHKPWFSPDGKRIVFMCENQGTLKDPPPDYNEDICVMNADGSNIVHVINTPGTIENYPSWGPAAP